MSQSSSTRTRGTIGTQDTVCMSTTLGSTAHTITDITGATDMTRGTGGLTTRGTGDIMIRGTGIRGLPDIMTLGSTIRGTGTLGTVTDRVTSATITTIRYIPSRPGMSFTGTGAERE